MEYVQYEKEYFLCLLRFSLMMPWVYRLIHVAHVNKTNLFTNKFVRTERKEILVSYERNWDATSQ
jgi:hypothetical protein